MNILKELGLEKNWIYETILVSGSSPPQNPVPMGVWTSDREKLKLYVYKVGSTYKNIQKSGFFVVSFPQDIDTFYKSVFSKESLEFEPDFPAVKDCPAALKMHVVEKKVNDDGMSVVAEIVDSRVTGKPVLINRAESLALESLIDYSKLSFVSEEKRLFFLEKIRENYRVICKSAPGSRFQDLVGALLEGIE